MPSDNISQNQLYYKKIIKELFLPNSDLYSICTTKQEFSKLQHHTNIKIYLKVYTLTISKNTNTEEHKSFNL